MYSSVRLLKRKLASQFESSLDETWCSCCLLLHAVFKSEEAEWDRYTYGIDAIQINVQFYYSTSDYNQVQNIGLYVE